MTRDMIAVFVSILIVILSFQSYLQTRVWKNNITVFRHALKNAKESWLSHTNLGIALQGINEPKQALYHFTRASQLKPDHIKSRINIGNAYFQLKHFDEAEKVYLEVLKEHPEVPQVYENLGKTYQLHGKREEAAYRYSQALELRPDNTETLFHISNIQFSLGKTQEGIKNLLSLTKIEPENIIARKKLAQAYHISGNLSGAIVQYEQTLKLNSRHNEAATYLAWILATAKDDNMRNGENAVQLAERIIRQTDPKLMRAVYFDALAAAYAETGKYDKAVNILKNGIRLLKDSDEKEKIIKFEERIKLYQNKKPFRGAYAIFE